MTLGQLVFDPDQLPANLDHLLFGNPFEGPRQSWAVRLRSTLWGEGGRAAEPAVCIPRGAALFFGQRFELLDRHAKAKGGESDLAIIAIGNVLDPRHLEIVDRAHDTEGLWDEYRTRRGEEEIENYQSEYDEAEEEAIALIGRPEKYAIPPVERKALGKLSDAEFEIYMLGYRAGKDSEVNRLPDLDEDPFEKK
ncbi:hypothetical protein [Rhizobium leguminosarum]|uniref:hypothetical protein n=1 Tax=Rhizobium leguminosarum TaxID=384 RepID=UPI0013F1784B|nr:hypothetical protein [Rhizobium leguminosarum]